MADDDSRPQVPGLESTGRRRMYVAGEVGPLELLQERVRTLEQSGRGTRRQLIALLVAAATSLGTVLIWAFKEREAAGGDKVRVQVLERDQERLRQEVEQLRSLVLSSGPAWPRRDPPRKDDTP